jgi:hypothetical protein
VFLRFESLAMSKTLHTGIAALALFALLMGRYSDAQDGLPFAASDERFCADVHIMLISAVAETRNTVQPNFEAFVKSKAQIRPLETQQFVLVEESQPVRVSCKLKSNDYVAAEYGNALPYNASACEAVNRRIIEAASRAIAVERRKITEDQIVYERDVVTFFGPSWLKPFAFAYQGADGKLHIRAKQFLVTRDTKVFFWAPDRWKGNMSCHLIAPEYARRLLTGEAAAPPQDAAGG